MRALSTIGAPRDLKISRIADDRTLSSFKVIQNRLRLME